ncbi:MAG: DUF7088 domain-containing protein, partial [Fimbriiglobus sp.]
MSSDPTPPTPVAPPAPAAGLVAFVIAQRAALAWVLLAVGMASAALCVVGVTRALSYTTAAKKADADKPDDPEKAEKKDAEKPDEPVRIPPPNQAEFAIGGVTGLLGAVVGLGLGAWLLAGLPPLAPEAQRTQARVMVLAAGGLFGLVMMFGSALFVAVPYFHLLVTWADTRVPPPGAWKFVVALLVFLLGAGLAFLAAQPARAEERTDPMLRRLVYGTNFALSTFLLVLVLFAGNVVAALKLPAQLDTTESGFYTLSDPTKEYLAALTQPMTVYTTIPDDRDRKSADIRRLLDAASAVNPAKFQIRALDPLLNKNDITSLRAKYPQVDFDEYGVLLTTGPDEKQYAFIRMAEFVSGTTFRGESVLAKELLGLSEGKTKPVVVFTQSSGELSIGAATAPDAADPKRSAAMLKLALEKAEADVKPWANTPGADGNVPDDATIVVVADPLRALPPAQIAAIKQFVTTPRDGKKGKLVVLAGAHANLDGSMTGTGLEDLLAAEFKVRLRPEFVYGEPGQIPPEAAIAGASRKLVTARNTLALAVTDYQVLPMMNFRLVELVAADRGAPPGGTT